MCEPSQHSFSLFLFFFQTALQGETVHFHQQSWESKVALCCLWADTELTRTPALTVVLLAQKGTTEGPPKSSDVVLRVWSHSSNICECSLKLNMHRSIHLWMQVKKNTTQFVSCYLIKTQWIYVLRLHLLCAAVRLKLQTQHLQVCWAQMNTCTEVGWGRCKWNIILYRT